jgi:Cu(I)/Ag(I) efflux system membrane fusion protein
VTFIDPIIDPQTRVASVRTEVNNPRGQLKPEMLVYGTLEQKKSNSKSTKLTVPKSAVLWTGKRSVVYVKVPDVSIPSYQFRTVELGASLGNHYMVLSGLKAGEEVVTKGSFTIDAAAQLNNQASMMNQEVKIKKASGSPTIPNFTTFTPAEFQRQLMMVTEQYLTLKNALVNTDPTSGASSAIELLTSLEQVDMSLLTGDAHRYWMEQLSAIRSHAQKITETSDVEVQRQQFDFLSQAMINVVKAYGLPDETIYIQHCPMANNDEGADWLSKEEEIRNPYFGEVMMTCGVVKEVVN